MVFNHSWTSNHVFGPQLLFLVRIVRNGHELLQHWKKPCVFPFPLPAYFCVGNWLKKSVPCLYLLLASLPMNYDNKQRLLLQMEEAFLCLHTVKTLGVDYV